MNLPRCFCCVTLAALLSAACGGKTASANNGDNNRVSKGGEPQEVVDSLFYLDLSKPSLRQAIDPKETGHEQYKFVQVEVLEVTNPQKRSLTFEVRYESGGGATSYLGSFSLYPSDNPGKFIVATLGRLRDEGAIVLSMVTPDKTDSGETIRVAVRKVKFLKG